MKSCFFSKSMRSALLVAMLISAAGASRAATSLQYFFPIENDLLTSLDDEVVVKTIFWGDESQPVPWVLLKPGNGPVLLPTFNFNNISDTDVLFAMERALQEWNNGGLSSFRYEDDVLYSTSGAIPAPQPIDADLDGYNTFAFQSQLVTLGTGVLAVTSLFFFEHDFDVEAFTGVPLDEIEPGVLIPLDLNLDGLIDISIRPRNYKQGEILESDIIFNSALTWVQWPEDPDDIPPVQLPFVPGSLDIESTAVHELGHAHGLGHSYIIDSTMSPTLIGPGFEFPTDPYKVRHITLDDKMATGLIYPAFPATTGEIRGRILDGQSNDLLESLGENPDLDNLSASIQLQLFVLEAPVFVGIPATPGVIHPDNVFSDGNVGVRLIAQVLSGQSLHFATHPNFPGDPIQGGVALLEPSTSIAVPLDLDGFGEDLNGNGVLDQGEDFNFNGVLDGSTTKIDSIYRFPGLPPRDDYAVYIDHARDIFNTGDEDPAPIAINNVYSFFGPLENFPREFYGGDASGDRVDSALNDDPLKIEYVEVRPGQVTSGIDIITNVEEDTGPGPTPTPGPGGEVPDGSAANPASFVRSDSAIRTTNYVALGADMGDINRDGYPDLAVAVFNGGSDFGGARFNRIYLNIPSRKLNGDDNTGSSAFELNSNPNIPRFFKDVTFGADEIPGTLDDVLPTHNESSRDCKFADFDNDGHLDLFVTNGADLNSSIGQGGFNRLYLWTEDLSIPTGFRYRDVSQLVLPGLLNRGQNPFLPASDAPFTFGDGRADSMRAAVGDIDGDGDLDIIVSLLTPANDATEYFAPNVSNATSAAIDTQPSANNNPGDDIYLEAAGSPAGQPDQISSRSFMNGFENSSFGETFAEPRFAGPLVFCEQVLINRLYNKSNPGVRGTLQFVDETLGADSRFGDSTQNTQVNGLGFFTGGNFAFSANTDRMPPVFPPTHNVSQQGLQAGIADSPMAYTAFEPHLGPIFQDTGLDLVSVRAFTDPESTGPDNGAQSAFFQNVEIDGDNIPDGYYFCLNYNADFVGRNGSGLFPLRTIQGARTLETYPLLIGLPDGTPGDLTGTGGDNNYYDLVDRGAFTGVIADWEYRGAPKPLVLADTTFGLPTVYFPRDAAGDFAQADGGARRAQNGIVTGHGISYLLAPPANSFPDALSLIFFLSPANKTMMQARDLPALFGESHGSVARDFDNDGDFDVMISNTLDVGYLEFGGTLVNNTPARNDYLVNDGFANFTKATDIALPLNDAANPPKIAEQVVAGDIDNDGDSDVIFINDLFNHDVMLNQIYNPRVKPDLISNTDPTQFFDQSVRFIPPFFSGSLTPPFAVSAFTGITVGVGFADFNGDGLYDVTTADGGAFAEGDYPTFYFNSGPPRQEAFRSFNEGSTVFKPIGSSEPAPRILPPLDESSTEDFSFLPIVNGFIGQERGAYYGVAASDFSGDGVADLLYSRNGEGPIAFLNVDSAVPAGLGLIPGGQGDINSFPDLDLNPDGIFVDLRTISNLPGFPTLMPDLTDPCPDPSGGVVLKRLGRRMAAADFDANGALDVCIGNGVTGAGAPNVLLLNTPYNIFPFPINGPRFTDVTETNLPTVLGDCGVPVGVFDDTYAVGAADFDHDGDVDLVFGNQSNTSATLAFPGFRYLVNDGFGRFTDTDNLANESRFNAHIPVFNNLKPRYIVVADFDGAGEWTEDLNHNGTLDAAEDRNGNGVIDPYDCDGDGFIGETETEDCNGNGILDPAEDINGNGVIDISEDTNGNGYLDPGEDIQGDPARVGYGNGVLDFIDLRDETSEDTNENGILDSGEDHNGNGVLDVNGGDLNGDGNRTRRTNGVWEPSFDMFITFLDTPNQLLLNDPTNRQPGFFTLSTALLPPFPTDGSMSIVSTGARAGDMDGDGDLDIVVGKGSFNAFTRPVQFLMNNLNNPARRNFTDRTKEFPFPTAQRGFFEQNSNAISFAGNAGDVELIDVDRDGDLDVYVGMAGRVESLVVVGGMDIMYINRSVPGNFNLTVNAIQPPVLPFPDPPVVFAADPSTAPPGAANLPVQVYGAHFETSPITAAQFGAGVTVQGVSYINPNKLIAVISVDAAAEIGPRSIAVQNPGSGGSSESAPGVFAVQDGPQNSVRPENWALYE